jgi:hypothetical protein
LLLLWRLLCVGVEGEFEPERFSLRRRLSDLGGVAVKLARCWLAGCCVGPEHLWFDRLRNTYLQVLQMTALSALSCCAVTLEAPVVWWMLMWGKSLSGVMRVVQQGQAVSAGVARVDVGSVERRGVLCASALSSLSQCSVSGWLEERCFLYPLLWAACIHVLPFLSVRLHVNTPCDPAGTVSLWCCLLQCAASCTGMSTMVPQFGKGQAMCCFALSSRSPATAAAAAAATTTDGDIGTSSPTPPRPRTTTSTR